ncbi:hypothetical protein A176_001633 [Myxococcus hansupus]|uniref:Uncharacterized protein n=1 Tax=Pseudomyxococcus hansupus TaxID=1297742 RepID=A0A0H4WMT0_9BACT|nr:hypothetical protein [Myxococcus hansupus]AKQ64721.1 hypothetical protein A176_001633 [Myxococcus hansupus]
MNLDSAIPVSPALKALAKSAEDDGRGDEPAVTPCPFAPKEKAPLRFLLWHLHQLGGGFHRPVVRPDVAIEAYATLVHRLKLDICILPGLTRTVGARATVVKTDLAGRVQLVMEDAVEDTGAREVLRILQQLKDLDPSGGWQARFLTSDVDGKYVYLSDSTTCVLFRGAEGLTLSKLDVVDSRRVPSLGLTGKLLCATFQSKAHAAEPVHVMAPLGAIHEGDLTEEGGTAPPTPAPKATRSAPESSLVALSAPTDLLSDRAAFNQFRSEMEALYQLPPQEGSVLRDDPWKSIPEAQAGLLANFSAVALDNVLLQNEHMHWDAMELPKHPENLKEVAGALADTLLPCFAAVDAPPRVEELRVVDLVRAALSAQRLSVLDAEGEARGDNPLPSEDSLLVGPRERFQSETERPPREATPVNELAECRYFSAALSTHWPVVAQLRWP